MKNIFKKTCFLVLVITAFNLVGQSTFNYNTDFKKILDSTKKHNSNLSYARLLSRFNVNDTTLTNYEMLALLIGFTDKPEYKPYQDIDTESNIYMLNDKGKYNEALQKGLSFIKTHPFSVKTLFEIAYSYHKLNNKDSEMFYLYKGQKIFEAMYFSGDGKTIETPIYALGPTDGQVYIKKFIGKKIGVMGSGSDKNGNFIDILEVKLDEGKTIPLYFIIQHATTDIMKSIQKVTKKYEKKFKKKKKEE